MTARTHSITVLYNQKKLNHWVLVHALSIGTSKVYDFFSKLSGWLIEKVKTQYSFPVLARVIHACYFHSQGESQFALMSRMLLHGIVNFQKAIRITKEKATQSHYQFSTKNIITIKPLMVAHKYPFTL